MGTTWLKRPKFFQDGSWILEKVKEVPKDSLRIVDLGIYTDEEFKQFWGFHDK